ncbi:hypothetical protein [Hansschlegelia zhihuaiae]|uniref:Uncharacterized protein n=1 Tax=Hansschlegelia zhihuaiae TaxID=405005 RepID=A0A4Q0M3G5_9HYPH|nr:hypothetical protein [Hansschlegelia zhihuaiae]RXF67116.1 hypothetical protein EK403_21720 [Hansschlegelia zhihuaiae]
MTTSEQSTSEEWKNYKTELFRLDDDIPSKLEEALEAVQQELVEERDSKKEERFVWLMALMLVFDAFMFKDMTTWAGPISIITVQILMMVALGRKWGMDHIWTITEKIIQKWDGKFGRGA